MPINSGKRVLIAEDSRTCYQDAESILREDGYLVDWAADGSKGIELFFRNQYDLVHSDWHMPQGNPAFIKRLSHISPATPVLIVASDVQDQNLSEICRLQNYRGYIPKPLEPEAYLERVKEIVAGKKRVLLVENWQPLAEILGEVLDNKCGADVATTQEAFRKSIMTKYDVIVVDAYDGQDELGLVNRLWRVQPQTPVLVICQYPTPEIEQMHNVRGHLTKPVDLEKYTQAMSDILARSV